MTKQVYSIGHEAAIKMAESEWWIGRTAREICVVQLFIEELCCPFEVFHKALGEALNRPVFTHELMNWDRLVAEFLGECPAPTLQQIIATFPSHVQVTVVVAP
jgi:hypothetical protein